MLRLDTIVAALQPLVAAATGATRSAGPRERRIRAVLGVVALFAFGVLLAILDLCA
jgi:hypothetical protein